MSADSAMKCTPQKIDEFGARPRRRILGQLERVAGHVGEPDHLVALVVMAEDERAVAERGARPLGPAHEGRVGLARQLARASDPALGAGSAPAPSTSSGSWRPNPGVSWSWSGSASPRRRPRNPPRCDGELRCP